MDSLQQIIAVVLSISILWISQAKCMLRCDCNTQECQDAGKTTCMARKACYTELYQNVLNRGCDPTPLACENRKPSGLDQLEWPALYCCHHKSLCNKNAIPTISTSTDDDDDPGVSEDGSVPYIPGDGGLMDEEGHDIEELEMGQLGDYPDEFETEAGNDSNSGCQQTDPELRARTQTKIVNPIYIAVPVAGVCVLLALIIFAMYLLRRRTDYHHPHDSSYNSHNHYLHDHSGGVRKGPDGQPGQQQQQDHHQLQHHPHHHHHQQPVVAPHHCHCMCKKQSMVAMPACGKTAANRCTDSERSSSGSETRLFLQS